MNNGNPLGLGATGKFPEGKLNPSDEGELKFAVAGLPDGQGVKIEFGKPVAWLVLPQSLAIELGKLLMLKAGAKSVEIKF